MGNERIKHAVVTLTNSQNKKTLELLKTHKEYLLLETFKGLPWISELAD